jgi:hypothetical protein
MRSLVAVFMGAACLLVSCTTSPDAYYESHPRCTTSQQDTDLAKRCLAAPQVRKYLENAQQRTLAKWKLPSGISADQSVTLTFRLSPDGTIECLSLSPDSERALARSVISAVQRATPFAALPSEATCLAQVPIAARFFNPETKQ